jgi:hypothetical protein
LCGETPLHIGANTPEAGCHFLAQLTKEADLRRCESNSSLFFIEPPSGAPMVDVSSRNLPLVRSFSGIPVDFSAWLSGVNSDQEFPWMTADALRPILDSPPIPAPPEVSALYEDLKLQWSSMAAVQWGNFPALLEAAKDLENELKANSDLFPDAQSQRIAFRVIMSHFKLTDFAAFDNVRIRSLIPFLKAYPASPGAEIDIFNGYRLLRECFWQFLIDPVNAMPGVLRGASALLQRKMEWVIGFYRNKQVDHLDFFMAECQSMFVDCFPDVERLWCEVLRNPVDFFSPFLAAFLIVMVPRLEARFFVSYGDFLGYFQRLKKKVSLVQILRVTASLRPNDDG